jgi:hypothetical protein
VKARVASLALLLSGTALAQECPPSAVPEGGVCLTKEGKDKVVAAVKELEGIHSAKAELKFKDEIVIIRDWDDRVYVNGGEKKPVRATLTLGDSVSRDMEVTLPVRISYREKPPDPLFRLRIRAQAGILAPELVKSIGGDPNPFWDAGIGWDFLHLGPANLAAYTGIRSAGGGFGLDLTKNFGPYAGYSFTYSGFRSSLLLGGYFSFN